jgi:excisionase family DNA binding protein
MSTGDIRHIRTVAAEPVPTLADIRGWPATVSVPQAATALGISRSHLYELIKAGECPFRVMHLRGRYIVVTSSIVKVLAGETEVA